MEAIKHMIRPPKDHTVQLHIPQHITENELVEVIMLVGTPQPTFNQKISLLKTAMRDELFLNDLYEVGTDFEAVDLEDWER
jgi:hypothetical protein